MANRIDSLRAPLFVSWQITRDCDLCCLHCCTDSAPGKRLPDELSAEETLRIAAEIIDSEVPYVMLCGGEPLVVPHFFQLAETLGSAGVQLKIETNGQRFDTGVAERLAKLPVRSIQVSLDGDTQEVYERQRPGGSLGKAHAACRAAREAGLPLEVTFAPTRINLHEAGAVISRARTLGAFRFNTGKLMRVGTAARLWDRLEPADALYREFRALLEREARIGGGMEFCYSPFTLGEALRAALEEPPATLQILPNGQVKVAAVLSYVCADLRAGSLEEAWSAYRGAWANEEVLAAARGAIEHEWHHPDANNWRRLTVSKSGQREAKWAT
jgi:MoaA/NifB/PqqE/SkfB family radical SAM enzyme